MPQKITAFFESCSLFLLADVKNCEKIPTAYGFGHFSFYRDIKNYFSNSTKFPVSFDDCLKTINLLNSFYISDEIKNSVNPMKIKDSKRLGIFWRVPKFIEEGEFENIENSLSRK